MKGATVYFTNIPGVFLEPGDLSETGLKLVSTDGTFDELIEGYHAFLLYANRVFIREIDGVEINLFLFQPLLATMSILKEDFVESSEMPIIASGLWWEGASSIEASGGYSAHTGLIKAHLDVNRFDRKKSMLPIGYVDTITLSPGCVDETLCQVKEWYLHNKDILEKFKADNPVRVFSTTGEKIFDNVPAVQTQQNTKHFDSLDDKL